MSQFSEAHTYNEFLACYNTIGARLSASRAALAFPKEDARQTALDGMQIVVGAFAFSLSTMIYKRNKQEILESFGTNNLTEQGAFSILESTWKDALLTLFLFNVDTLFQNLLQALGHYREKMGNDEKTSGARRHHR